MRVFFEFTNRSFFGHVVLYQLVVSLPVFIWFLVENHNEGTLTLLWTAQFALVAIAVGVAIAFAIWHTVTLPLLRRAKENSGK